MADPGTIRQIIERNIKLLAVKPSRGQLTCTTRARLVDGLRCEIEEGPWRLAADMPAKAGGDETAPTPGVLGRAALASCLAIGIASWSARLGVPIETLEVEVQADFDARGELGVGGRPARLLRGPLRDLDRQPGSRRRAGPGAGAGRAPQPLSGRVRPAIPLQRVRASERQGGLTAMDPRLQRRVQRYGWDRAVGAYEEGWGTQLEPAHAAMLEMADLRPGERVLDVACGTGLVSLRVARLVGAAGRSSAPTSPARWSRRRAAVAAQRGIGQRPLRARRCRGAAVRRRQLRCRPVRPRAHVRARTRSGRCARCGACCGPAAGRPRPSGVPGSACGWAEIFPITDARVASDVCPMFFQLGTRDTLARTLRGRRLRRRPRRAAADELHYASAEEALARRVPRRAGGPRLQPLRRADQAGGPRRIPQFHRRLRGGRWLPDAGRVRRCRRPGARSISHGNTGRWHDARN